MRCNTLKQHLRSYSYCLVLTLLASTVLAKPAASVKVSVQREEGKSAETLILPYAFATEGMGTVFGLGAIRKGFVQPQMVTGITAFGGEETQAAMVGVWDFRIPYTQRLYLSFIGMYGDFPRNLAYSSGHLYYPDSIDRPGSNESNKEQHIQGAGLSNWTDLRLEYSLPIGATASSGMVDYQLQRGLLVSEPSGGENWNPLTSGVSVLIFRQYNHRQTFLNETLNVTVDNKISAYSLGFLYDNSDFPVNPTKGSKQYIAVHHNPDSSDEFTEWNFAELELSKYLSLGSSEWARQRVLAFNTWLSYSPSWTQESDGNGQSRVVNNPPFNQGSTLGGFYRMRGYDQNRFSDKAAIYAAAEYRYTLEYNPVEGVSWLKFLHMDWAQLAFFAEAGRVAPQFDDTLLKDMKFDAGIGLRALMAGTIVRLDMAYSDEGVAGWVMIGQPF